MGSQPSLGGTGPGICPGGWARKGAVGQDRLGCGQHGLNLHCPLDPGDWG